MLEPRWRQEGEEPDYRFSLANERTFLAWIRTALALLAGGVVLEQFATRLRPHAVLIGVAVLLATLAAALCGAAYMRWRDNEIAMRHRRRLAHTFAIPLLSMASCVVAALLAVLLLLQ